MRRRLIVARGVRPAFAELLQPVLAGKGLDSSDPHDVMRWIDEEFHHPAELGRAGLPEEVASAMVFLALPRNGCVTGVIVNVVGGPDFV